MNLSASRTSANPRRSNSKHRPFRHRSSWNPNPATGSHQFRLSLSRSSPSSVKDLLLPISTPPPGGFHTLLFKGSAMTRSIHRPLLHGLCREKFLLVTLRSIESAYPLYIYDEEINSESQQIRTNHAFDLEEVSWNDRIISACVKPDSQRRLEILNFYDGP